MFDIHVLYAAQAIKLSSLKIYRRQHEGFGLILQPYHPPPTPNQKTLLKSRNNNDDHTNGYVYVTFPFLKMKFDHDLLFMLCYTIYIGYKNMI